MVDVVELLLTLIKYKGDAAIISFEDVMGVLNIPANDLSDGVELQKNEGALRLSVA